MKQSVSAAFYMKEKCLTRNDMLSKIINKYIDTIVYI